MIFEEYSDNSTNGVNAASTLVTVVGQNSTKNTNTFSDAGPSNNAITLNFKLGGKSLYVDPSQYLNDLDMPALKDITYSDDEEDVGAEAEFSNLETNINFSPIPTTRVYKDHTVTQIIGDLSLAPQTRSMTRMKNPREHQALKDPSWIEAMQEELLQFKMQKDWGHTQEEGIDYEDVFALIARIEAIRLFLAYASFMGFMVYQMDVKSSFLYGTIEEEVYVCQPLGFEDSDYHDKVYKVVKALYGLHQAPRACQDKYVADILRKFGLTDGKSTSTPIYTKKPLPKDPDDDLSSHKTKYTSPALTQKVFANMRRIGKGFSKVETPLFATMLMVNTHQSTPEFSGHAFDAAVQRAVNALLLGLTAQITNELRQNGAGGNGDQPPTIRPPEEQAKHFKWALCDWILDGIVNTEFTYVAHVANVGRNIELLRERGDGKSASTPIDTEKPLLKDPDDENVDVHTYKSMIGSLMYLTSSRPDIMFAVCACACF
uniref:Reverse transcriptase Ty1/copia-type domain-containing protein n=1 Tax=Tanacetum cinerariifolium TaxID=118510 RepID=A0A6L2LTW7_TANCI|nr:hypothetical protein [Tanacetum cinerariifolium]